MKKKRENYLPLKKIKKKEERRKKNASPLPPSYPGLLGNLSMALLLVSVLNPRWAHI